MCGDSWHRIITPSQKLARRRESGVLFLLHLWQFVWVCACLHKCCTDHGKEKQENLVMKWWSWLISAIYYKVKLNLQPWSRENLLADKNLCIHSAENLMKEMYFPVSHVIWVNLLKPRSWEVAHVLRDTSLLQRAFFQKCSWWNNGAQYD